MTKKKHDSRFVVCNSSRFNPQWVSWRVLAGVSCLFPVCSFILLYFVPESPSWLITQGEQNCKAWNGEILDHSAPTTMHESSKNRNFWINQPCKRTACSISSFFAIRAALREQGGAEMAEGAEVRHHQRVPHPGKVLQQGQDGQQAWDWGDNVGKVLEVRDDIFFSIFFA